MNKTLLLVSLMLCCAGAVSAGTVTIPNTFTAGTTSSAAQVNANFTAVKTAVDDNAARVVPAGAMMPFAGATPPGGWLLCNGAVVSRVTYSSLFAAIGIAWGSGDGTTTFHLPDMRGRFARGVDGAAGNDPDTAIRIASNAGGNTGDAVGSLQADEITSHVHAHQLYGQTVAFGVFGIPPQGSSPTPIYKNTTATGGNETRPKNIGVTYIIKD